MKVDIVIVNWNSGAQLIECLDSIELFHANFVNRVVIVDNASSDNSLPEKNYLGFTVEIIKNTTNTGFSRACNVGARLCHSELILFLNPDTKLFADTLPLSVQLFNNDLNGEIGVLGVKSIGSKPNEVNRHCARFPTPSMYFYHSTGLANFLPKFFPHVHLTDFDHLTSRAVDHVIGAYYMMRRSLFDYLGGFDERYFVYMEDLDFSLRVQQSGKVVYYLADAAIFHKAGGTSSQIKAKRLYYSTFSKLKYSKKWFDNRGRAVVFVSLLLIEPLVRIARSILKMNISEVRELFQAYVYIYSNFNARDL